ncbi:MAG: hypothetical protein COT90_02330, partial [Candidatus Diapherotrites archaeon CG10_big_fil_rev_8_21_14_0_10_31_34]
TNNTGQVKLKAQKEFTEITISANGYKKQTIILVFRTDKCGNEECEQEFENTSNCPADCKTEPEKLTITTTINENSLIIKITDSAGNPIKDVKITYGEENKLTNSNGITEFQEIPGIKEIKAEKTGYQTKTLSYTSTKECNSGQTKSCETKECSGTQTCTNEKWGACNAPETCTTTEPPTSPTTLALAGILIIGIIIFAATKTKNK